MGNQNWQHYFDKVQAILDKAAADLEIREYMTLLKEVEVHVECSLDAARDDLDKEADR